MGRWSRGSASCRRDTAISFFFCFLRAPPLSAPSASAAAAAALLLGASRTLVRGRNHGNPGIADWYGSGGGSRGSHRTCPHHRAHHCRLPSSRGNRRCPRGHLVQACPMVILLLHIGPCTRCRRSRHGWIPGLLDAVACTLVIQRSRSQSRVSCHRRLQRCRPRRSPLAPCHTAQRNEQGTRLSCSARARPQRASWGSSTLPC